MFIAMMCNLKLALANQDLVVTITPNVNYAFEGQVITFTANVIGNEGTVHYLWKEGDNEVGTSSSKECTMPSINESPYQITCTVTDDNGPEDGDVSITIIKVNLKEVTFSNNHTMRKDDSSIDYTAPHYSSNLFLL